MSRIAVVAAAAAFLALTSCYEARVLSGGASLLSLTVAYDQYRDEVFSDASSGDVSVQLTYRSVSLRDMLSVRRRAATGTSAWSAWGDP